MKLAKGIPIQMDPTNNCEWITFIQMYNVM